MFQIPVEAFDQDIAVIADTVAMSKPHEVEYTLNFHAGNAVTAGADGAENGQQAGADGTGAAAGAKTRARRAPVRQRAAIALLPPLSMITAWSFPTRKILQWIITRAVISF